ncbi:uncharacterized protein Gasu_24820 [Galdieria sulphuraria]|uniref:Uncharacterized protein n=1 Tax=Galdieria sulphuraria TaxID=130081 RepID=M2Y2Q3_GALSU|nr:uncharacterized protein Gasu_24820 [Galdieria sulphuraria]EME30099.1 hypothetical protein Gasu_24820 [Galdieria sulphuraria]|eukprot:XP_005706619.1 hypothetical protein Gasu_24820 [Galdieria sulphuraria]
MLRASEKARKPRVHIFDGPSNEDMPFFMEEIRKIKLAELSFMKGEEELVTLGLQEASQSQQLNQWDVTQLEQEEREIQRLKEEIQRLQVTKKELFQKLKEVLVQEKREKSESFH